MAVLTSRVNVIDYRTYNFSGTDDFDRTIMALVLKRSILFLIWYFILYLAFSAVYLVGNSLVLMNFRLSLPLPGPALVLPLMIFMYAWTMAAPTSIRFFSKSKELFELHFHYAVFSPLPAFASRFPPVIEFFVEKRGDIERTQLKITGTIIYEGINTSPETQDELRAFAEQFGVIEEVKA